MRYPSEIRPKIGIAAKGYGLEVLCAKGIDTREDLSRKGAKRYRVSKGLSLRLCVFAREIFLLQRCLDAIGVLFVQGQLEGPCTRSRVCTKCNALARKV